MASQHSHEIVVRSPDGRELRFEHVNHDDLLEIAARVTAGSGLQPDAAAALAVGLKLLAETTMSLRDVPPYDALWPELVAFTRALKSRLASGAKNDSNGPILAQ